MMREATVYGDSPDAEARVILGRNVSLEDAFLNVVCGTITIGDNSFFGHRVMLLTGSHKPNGAIAEQGRDIVIGEGCWIASGVIVLGPCRIGDRAIVGAGAVVTRDCEAGCFYAGNPARKIRKV